MKCRIFTFQGFVMNTKQVRCNYELCQENGLLASLWICPFQLFIHKIYSLIGVVYE